MKEKKKGIKNLSCKVTALRGMADILPEEIKYWRHIEKNARRLFYLYGYKEIRLPLLEETELFRRSIGGDTEIVNKEMYTIKTARKSISLRPEGTGSLVRAFLEHNLYLGSKVKKYYYLGPMFRRERPQAGRMRQFHQLGAEAIGSGEPALDAEVISLASNLLNKIGIKKFEIQLNHLGCLSCRTEFIADLKGYFKTYLKALCPDCQRRFTANTLRILDCKKEECRSLIKAAPKIIDILCHKCNSHFKRVQEILKLSNINFRLNPHLVRGLDYYTAVVFEVIHLDLGAQNALGAGGRYDGLIERFGGPSLPAAGFSFGMERIISVLKEQKAKIDIQPKTKIFLIVLGEENFNCGFKILQQLRREGISAEMDFENKSLKAQLRLADKMGSKLVLILGDEEITGKSIQIKNMETGKQELVKIDGLMKFLKTELLDYQLALNHSFVI